MDSPGACPDHARLRALIAADLAEDLEPVLIDHLTGCPACRALIDGWADPAGVLEGLDVQHARRPRSPALEHVLNEMKVRGTGPCPTLADDPADGLTIPRTGEHLDRPEGLGRVGPYQVIGEVGRGGMGVVLKALDPALNRIVAIKRLAPELASSPQARRRFLREARAAAAVCHEHVVTIHAVDESDGAPYIVMQYVAGLSLQEKIDREGPLGLKVVLRVGMQVAAGLAAAHAQGLVHRDIKPANILLENGVERAKITDFGLARAATDARLTQSGTLTGTPQYMAPEQARGEDVDHRTDLFSLGGVLYAMATGKAPFEGDSAVAVLRQVSDEPHRPVTALNPELPPWLGALIDRLMAKDPAARYQSAAEVAELLGSRLAELQRREGSATGTASPAPEPSRRLGLRMIGKAPVLAALALIALTALAVSLARNGRPARVSTSAPVRAVVDVERAVVANPNPNPSPEPAPVATPPDWLTLGLAAKERRDYAEAVRCFSAFLAQNPESTRALLARGDAYRYLKNYAAALADYNELIRVAPQNGEAYYSRAFILVRNKDFDGALADCDEALRLNPSLTWAYFHRGLADNGRKDWDRAIADFSTFIDRVPNFGEAYRSRAASYQNRGDLVLGLADLDVALELEPNNTGYYHYRGWLRARLGELDRAIADYTRALRNQPDDVVIRSDRACARALAGQYDQAEADFEVALQGAGSYPWPLIRRAYYLDRARGDFERAVADCDRMIAVDPNFAESYLNRGLILLTRGDPARAVPDFDQVLALNQPDTPTFEGRLSSRYAEIYQARGDARAQLGDLAGAKADHDQAAQLRSNPSSNVKATPRPN